MVDPFVSRVDTTVVPVADRNPAAFGGGVGEGLQMLGGTLEQVGQRQAQVDAHVAENNHRIAMLHRQREVQQATISGLTDFEAMQSDIAAYDRQLQQQIGTASPDYQAKLAEYRAKRTDDFLGKYGQDPDLAERFVPMVARLRANESERAAVVAAQGVAQEAHKASQELGDQFYNSARTDRSAANIALLHQKADAFVTALPLPPEQRREVARMFEQRIAVGAIEKAIDDDPRAALETIQEGAFNEVLTAQQSEAVRTHAETEVRRREAEGRAQQAVLLRQQKEALATQRASLDTGAGTPNDWFDLGKRYEAIGDTSSAVEARAKGTQMLAIQSSRDLSLTEMQSRISALQAKPVKTPEEASMLAGLQDQFRQSRERLNGTGGALAQYAYATSKTLAPIDPAKPETLAARAQLAAAASAKYGRPNVEPLLPDEVESLRQLTEGGPEKRLQALTMLAGFGDPRAVYGAARQITNKEDGAFRIAAMRLGIPGGRQLASDILRGGEAMKVAGKAWNQAGAMQTFQQYVGGSLVGVGPEFAADTLEAAKAIYASQLQAAGKSEWDPKAFEGAIERALGGYNDGQFAKGGSAVWKGYRVLVPTGWTGDGVFGRLARMNADAVRAAQTAGTGVWPDGSPLYSGQLRDGSLIPVLMTGTTYAFRSSRTGRLLPSKNGVPYLLDMAKVPW